MRLSSFLSGLLALASASIWAQSTPNLVVTFSSAAAEAQAVPLSSWALLIPVLVIVCLVMRGRRLGIPGALGAVLVAVTAMLFGALIHSNNVIAQTVTRTLALVSSPSQLALSNIAEDIALRNDTANAIRLQSMSIANDGGAAYFISTFGDITGRCTVGQILQAGERCDVRIATGAQYLQAQAGDLLKVQLHQLRPTQPAVGFDQIYYHLVRKQPNFALYPKTSSLYVTGGSDFYSRYVERSERKRVADYCEDTGRIGVDADFYVNFKNNYAQGADINVEHVVNLLDTNTFKCSVAEEDIDPSNDKLKTVVIGPEGQLYLTDGHHTFNTLWALADGGPDLPVWVRVTANFSSETTMTAFWDRMIASNNVWLNKLGTTITPDQLPTQLGLEHFSDDPYRSLVYLTRDMGYTNGSSAELPNGLPEFAEFYWANWLRAQSFLSTYTLTNLDRARIRIENGQTVARTGDSTISYVAAARDAALLMAKTPSTTVIGGSSTAASLGQLPLPIAIAGVDAWNIVLDEDIQQNWDRTSDGRPRTAGKAWYANQYRACGNQAANTNYSCWNALKSVAP